MNDVARKMDFDVYTNLKDRNQEYNIKIDLDNEVSPDARELAIALSGAIVRNNFKMIYGKILNDEELATSIKDRLNTWAPKEANLKVNAVQVSLKKLKSR
jgi:hypothetical protein